MSEAADRSLAGLRAALAEAAAIEDLAERALEVVSVVEAVAAPLGVRPVVVGGMAVYFWTADEAFVTHDIDVVMPVPEALDESLSELGFERSADGRHWRLRGTEIFLEAPSAELDREAAVTQVTLESGRTAEILSRVEVLVDRLDEFQATGHESVAQQILVLLQNVSTDQAVTLRARAEQRRVRRALDAMTELAAEIDAGRTPPTSDELHRIARASLRAEYTSRRS